MTRIIAGRAGGRRLATPKGAATRPTSDRVREALFSVVESWAGSLRGLRFLDLYAGSGAIGLEAVASTTDGFELSRVDLEQRREGDVLGRNQSGFRSSLQNLRVLRDEDTIVAARGAAESLIDRDPALADAPALAAAVAALEESQQAGFVDKS